MRSHFNEASSPTPVILTNGKDLPAKPPLDTQLLGFERALRAGMLRSGQHDGWWERFMRKAITPGNSPGVIARVEEEVIELGRYPDIKTASSMATSEPSIRVT